MVRPGTAAEVQLVVGDGTVRGGADAVDGCIVLEIERMDRSVEDRARGGRHLHPLVVTTPGEAVLGPG